MSLRNLALLAWQSVNDVMPHTEAVHFANQQLQSVLHFLVLWNIYVLAFASLSAIYEVHLCWTVLHILQSLTWWMTMLLLHHLIRCMHLYIFVVWFLKFIYVTENQHVLFLRFDNRNRNGHPDDFSIEILLCDYWKWCAKNRYLYIFNEASREWVPCVSEDECNIIFRRCLFH